MKQANSILPVPQSPSIGWKMEIVTAATQKTINFNDIFMAPIAFSPLKYNQQMIMPYISRGFIYAAIRMTNFDSEWYTTDHDKRLLRQYLYDEYVNLVVLDKVFFSKKRLNRNWIYGFKITIWMTLAPFYNSVLEPLGNKRSIFIE